MSLVYSLYSGSRILLLYSLNFSSAPLMLFSLFKKSFLLSLSFFSQLLFLVQMLQLQIVLKCLNQLCYLQYAFISVLDKSGLLVFDFAPPCLVQSLSFLKFLTSSKSFSCFTSFLVLLSFVAKNSVISLKSFIISLDLCFSG